MTRRRSVVNLPWSEIAPRWTFFYISIINLSISNYHTNSKFFSAQIMQVTKCSACDTPLQLPTVHFLCKHAYHVHCFESYNMDGSDKCPACQTTRDTTRDEEISYHKFQKELAEASNGMELIAMYLQRGLFDEKTKKTKKSEVEFRLRNKNYCKTIPENLEKKRKFAILRRKYGIRSRHDNFLMLKNLRVFEDYCNFKYRRFIYQLIN